MPFADRGIDPNVGINVVQLDRDDMPPDHVDASIIHNIVRHDSGFIDDDVAYDEEEILISNSDDDEEIKRGRINSANRGKLEVSHIVSLKSFVRLRHDIRDSVTGQEPGPVDLYRGTHCRQVTGSWVYPKASENWAAMDTICSQPTPNGTQRSEPEILSEVLGTRSVYVRGLGHGAKLMTPVRATYSQSIAGESTLR
ncbi:uncharacterized protein LOC131256345 [Magnolia sinica]|uniref:uncharacterized protein LOC131256345 n=1 Tax=Magnolia sinica TaxID=86752 RepID=UPI002659829F|nr:uncharacterized protein LOC131256345 [Magnolia sinica]